MNSDSSDSDPDTGRFKSSKLKENSGGRYKTSEDNVPNYQKRMPALERKQEQYKRHTDREREESRTSRDSKSKYSDDHKSTHSSDRPKETSRTELKSNVSSSKSDVKRRRSRSRDRNSKILDDERKKKYNMDERTRHPEDSRRNREKSKKNSHERDTQYSGQSSKSHSPHRHHKEKEKSDDRRSIGSNKQRSDSKSSHSDHRSDSSSKSLHENVSFGPALPPPVAPVETKANVIVEKKYVGPKLPPGFKLNSRHSSSDDVEMEEPRQNIGPQIPKNILEQIQLQRADVDITEHNFDKVSSSEEEEEDDDCSFAIGPMPAGSTTLTAAQLELEKRALEIKIKKLDDAEGGSSRKLGDEREEWMIELPEIRRVADLGLGARQFRTKERPDFDDRTQWTNTPLENTKKGKEQKIDLQKAQKKLLQAARDHEQDKIANSHKKKNKRDSSLMDIHKKTLKMNEKKDAAVGRRPFDRDLDLQVNRFDEARNKATLKKAALLDTRFASSKQGKYL